MNEGIKSGKVISGWIVKRVMKMLNLEKAISDLLVSVT